MKNFYMIKWGADFNDNYNYGADIRFVESDYVRFSSPLMPSGTAIKTWHSRTEYHESRKSPMLPLLENGQAYEIQVNAEFDNEDAVQIEIEFFDINNDVIDKLYFQNLKGHFTYPDNAMSYKVQLVNKKHQYMLFKYLTISDAGLTENFNIQYLEKLNLIRVSENHAGNPSTSEIVVLKNAKYVTSLTLSGHINYYFLLGNTTEASVLPAAVYIYDQLRHSGRQNLVTIMRGPCFNSLTQSYKYLPEGLAILLPTARLSNTPKKPVKQISELKRKLQVNELAYSILEKVALEKNKPSSVRK
ncbi:accessory Sec system protein Asp3 [Enterococcus pallens]|uniref:Accessory Sec system protein Asp3 n=1 Tax=Enterococcus pallens ATCC BAA-351 TaxID=1158607 RepID=R2Q5W8_9ENTE|nr:accessory Sec system protein Asp3 [Enterococcus pallens]EOH91912.1 accessory Sec system protein Asp3 [Enterococcus pallens ATCC BAA-351]EOU25339.1 accessory Sec system protein Asp3 [Enterococcus pallens ATCC BAA-351]